MRTRTTQFAVYSDTKQALTPRAPPRGHSRSVQPSPPPRQILATGQQIILPFLCRSRSARSTNWQSGNLTKCVLIQTSLCFVCRAVCDAQKTEKRREFSGQDVQLYNRARTAIRLPPGQGFAPTPRICASVLNVTSGSLPLPRPLARSLTFGRWGCGERCHLSHVVGDSAVILSGMSRQEPRQPPAKPICTAQAAIRLVGGRRPSMLQRWGSGVLPRRFPVALKALPEP